MSRTGCAKAAGTEPAVAEAAVSGELSAGAGAAVAKAAVSEELAAGAAEGS